MAAVSIREAGERDGRPVLDVECDRCHQGFKMAHVDGPTLDPETRNAELREGHAEVFGWQYDPDTDEDVCPNCIEPPDITGAARPPA
jgi:hypothetical protein